MEHMIQLHIEKLPEGVYLATSEEVQGLIAQGRTIQENRDRARRGQETDRGADRSQRYAPATGSRGLRLSADRRDLINPMGALAGFRYREIIKRLKALGLEFHRQTAGSHEIWFNPALKRYTTIPNHPGDMPEGTLRAILK